ncbi:phage minor head protein [Atlantibacter subterraneus]|uniref:phage minor head protein n=1 Tax=Atlantibacter subterraneus TaxID=255519 RepID=UPI002963F908|nr:phage minor head protein [Atlantibacter subterranea]MDW2743354.1 phage minor head protein [Atlantibacter subterranea]
MKKRKTKPPILPGNLNDPTGADRLERGAINEFGKRIRRIAKAYQDILDRIPASPAVNLRYTFDLDTSLLSMLLENASALVDEILYGGNETNFWYWRDYVNQAYQRGTAQEFANLSQQSAVYAAGRENLQQLLLSEPYQRRLLLVRTRVFEEMKNLSARIKSEMARVLTDGMGRGQNPRDIAKRLTEQTGIVISRAKRIARTEITTALRRARWDESDEAEAQYGIMTRQMHLSALSPTTRRKHALRHGHLYTTEEVRDWYSVDGNAINCYLPDTEVQGRFVAGSKSYYEGMVVKLVTRSGRNLTVTPNHPVMTDRGLIAANEVTERDNLFAYGSNVENTIGVGDLHDQHGVSAIQDVFSSLVESGHSIFRGVSAVDFYGDGSSCDGEVHIVRSYWQLPVACDTHVSKMLDYFALKHADSISALVQGASFSDLVGIDLSSPDVEGGGSHQLSFFRSGNRESVDGGSTSPSALNACCFQTSFNDATGNSNSIGDGLFRQSGLIEIDEVVSIERYFFEGHVYDLEEVSGLMIANGIISSNCKCTQVAVLVDASGHPLNPNIVDMAKKRLEKARKAGLIANHSHCDCGHH